MAVIDQDNFSNISWNSDNRNDDESDANNYTPHRPQISSSSQAYTSRMADEDYNEPLSPGGESRPKNKATQKSKQKQKQKQTQKQTHFKDQSSSRFRSEQIQQHQFLESLARRASTPLSLSIS